jgi:hypothetical protein
MEAKMTGEAGSVARFPSGTTPLPGSPGWALPGADAGDEELFDCAAVPPVPDELAALPGGRFASAGRLWLIFGTAGPWEMEVSGVAGEAVAGALGTPGMAFSTVVAGTPAAWPPLAARSAGPGSTRVPQPARTISDNTVTMMDGRSQIEPIRSSRLGIFVTS